MKKEPDSKEPGSGAAATEPAWIVTRRDFLKISVLGALSASPLSALGAEERPAAKARFGIVTDAHYADAPNRGKRFYRQSPEKMAECVELMNRRKVDFLVELGDFKDQDEPPVEKKTLSHLRAIEKVFQQFEGPKYHVLGNHDVDSISKAQFLANVENSGVVRKRSYYSFDSKGLHFVVLDANFRPDGSPYDHGNFKWNNANVPPAELDWLKRDLASTTAPVIVFTHQVLDGKGDHTIRNADAVRKVLRASGKVVAVFQGHKHTGGYSSLGGIHYYTLRAMVEGSGRENSSYAIVEVGADNAIVVTGYRKAVSKRLEAGS